MEEGQGLVLNSSFGEWYRISRSTEIWFILVFITTSVLHELQFLTPLVVIFGPEIIEDM